MAETTETSTTEATTVEQLPQFAQDMIKSLRDEAAKHRTAKGEAVEAAKAELTASLTADFETKLAAQKAETEAAQTETSTHKLALDKLRTALGARVEPTVFEEVELFAGQLKGSTEDEVKTEADGLKRLLGAAWGKVPATDPSPEGGKKHLALNDDDGLLNALMGAVGAPTD